MCQVKIKHYFVSQFSMLSQLEAKSFRLLGLTCTALILDTLRVRTLYTRILLVWQHSRVKYIVKQSLKYTSTTKFPQSTVPGVAVHEQQILGVSSRMQGNDRWQFLDVEITRVQSTLALLQIYDTCGSPVQKSKGEVRAFIKLMIQLNCIVRQRGGFHGH